jgi:GNAT superfamily N-acetyltransferase
MSVIIEEWNELHPRWPELEQTIEALNQVNWINFKADFHQSSHLLAAQKENTVVGFLRFVIQEIGADEERPPVIFDGAPLIEAKIVAFGVRKAFRQQGIGRALQEEALRQARRRNCHQVRSHSSGWNEANHHLKLAMGFGVHPIVRGEDDKGVYFVMPLKGIPDVTQK